MCGIRDAYPILVCVLSKVDSYQVVEYCSQCLLVGRV